MLPYLSSGAGRSGFVALTGEGALTKLIALAEGKGLACAIEGIEAA